MDSVIFMLFVLTLCIADANVSLVICKKKKTKQKQIVYKEDFKETVI